MNKQQNDMDEFCSSPSMGERKMFNEKNVQFTTILVHKVWSVNDGAAEDPLEPGEASFQLVSSC
jgi:hypothetical protein